MSRVARGTGALLVLLSAALGLPVALWAVTGWLVDGVTARGMADLASLDRLLTGPADGSLVLVVLTLVGWLGWATFALALGTEVVARLRGVPTWSIPGLGTQQRVVGALVAAVLMLAAPVTAATAAQPAHAPSGPVATTPADLPLLAPAPSRVLAAATTAAAVAAPLPTVVVAEGDTLWRLAETHLGSGMRWRELAAANYGRSQPDGPGLDSGHILQPGWTLQVPEAAVAPVEDEHHLVVEGDTLSSIAAAALGDAGRYPELAAATAAITQPDGRRLSDPDLILPGWTVAIPDVSNEPIAGPPATQPAPVADVAPTEPSAADVTPAEPPAADVTPAEPAAAEVAPVVPAPVELLPVEPLAPAPAPAAPGPPPPQDQAGSDAVVAPTAAMPPPDPGAGDEPPGAADTPAPAAADTPAPAAADADPSPDAQEAISPLRTATGIGALLAAGFLAVLALRRSRQRAHRRPGQRIALPSRPATQVVEAQLREVAATIHPAALAAVLVDLATACRVSGVGLPRLRAARLEPDAVELYLASPAVLPQPWLALGEESTIWTRRLPHPTVDAGPARDPLTEDAVTAVDASPYPTLVTLGHDTDTSLLLVNLDELGVLDVTGGGRSAAETQAALAAELATSPWSADVLVTVVGADAALCDALPSGRIRTVDQQRLLVELRARAAAVESDLSQAGSQRIADARHAEAADDGSWRHSDLEYEVVVVMAPLTEATERELIAVAGPRHGISVVLSREVDLAATRDQALEEQAMWVLEHRTPENGEPSAMLHPVAVPLVPQTLGVDALHALLDAVSQTGLVSVAAVAADDPIATLWPPRGVGHESRAVQGSGVTPSDPESEPDRGPAPLLRLLGPVSIEGAGGPEPGTHTARTVALIAVLATHRHGRTRDQLTAALSPNNRLADATLHALVSRARRWLGTAPDGRSYLPRSMAAGSAVYQLDPEVGTDWDAWRHLIGPEPARTPVERLTEALDLVVDAPLAGVIERHYTWAEPLREEMIASIVDVAHVVADRALQRRDFALARRSVQAGRRADPTSEVLWRDALRIENAAGAHGTVASLVNHIQQWSDDSGLDLDPATEALVLQLGSSAAAVSEQQAATGLRT